MPRLDTSFESSGAEFLVLGHLLIEGIQAFKAYTNFQNLTIKKIPKHVLYRCEWDHDDYSLQVENLPKAPPEPIEAASEPPNSPAAASDQLQLEL